MNIKSKILIPRILFYWIVLGLAYAISIIPWMITRIIGGIFSKILHKIDPRRLHSISPKQTKNRIVRLYARTEGIQSVRIDGERYNFREELIK